MISKEYLGRYKTEQEAKEAYQNFKSFVFKRSTTNECT